MDIQGGPKERNIYDLSYFRHQSYDIAFYSNYGRTLFFFSNEVIPWSLNWGKASECSKAIFPKAMQFTKFASLLDSSDHRNTHPQRSVENCADKSSLLWLYLATATVILFPLSTAKAVRNLWARLILKHFLIRGKVRSSNDGGVL